MAGSGRGLVVYSGCVCVQTMQCAERNYCGDGFTSVTCVKLSSWFCRGWSWDLIHLGEVRVCWM